MQRRGPEVPHERASQVQVHGPLGVTSQSFREGQDPAGLTRAPPSQVWKTPLWAPLAGSLTPWLGLLPLPFL